MSDFGRAHPEHRIRKTELEKRVDMEDGNPGVDPEFTGALDPAVPEVYEHHMAIFREVAERYDIDGIEFDWRRWWHMISDPHKNHPILTQMVRDTRKMLDEIARRKTRDRLLLGVRVGPMLDGEFHAEEFPGASSYPDSWWAGTTPEFRQKEFPDAICPGPNKSCRDLGLDVETWIEEGLVDYVCPSLFIPTLPGVPRTAEFAAIAKNRNVGIYPTVMPEPAWATEEISIVDMSLTEIRKMMQRHRDEMCNAALMCYAEGADGISTFNWGGHSLYSSRARRRGISARELALTKTAIFVHQLLGSAEALRECLKREPEVTLDCQWSS